MKLNHEKLQNESLEMKFKLVDQDNQNLRKTLLYNSRKNINPDKANRNHMEQVNELIEKAQKNAMSVLASHSYKNPNELNLSN
ncbi:hypothetical protein BpHYR1_023593 [Brachionus plicatilis]|uniref:Uncharacterized protein n=1 Tax=Brachionus plicatilis TaxID=10195 RepID=A0A3M7P2V0_BRAPC|nr:hypothetical protein BpHYR1_023593 [Brachionus plicatilis]